MALDLVSMVQVQLSAIGYIKDAEGKLIETEIVSKENISKFLELADKDVKLLIDYDGDSSSLVVDNACYRALMAMALIEKGREYDVHSDGVSYSVPEVSDLLMRQANFFHDSFLKKIEMLRFSL